MAALFGLAVAYGQTPDTSGNALLHGSYRFRHVAVQNLDEDFNPAQITASYGTITFDGAGNYKVTGTSVDNTVSHAAPQTLSVSGTYAIGANGAGYIANPLHPTDSYDYIYGAVAQGVYTGSSTEAVEEISEVNAAILNDIFIAIPVGTPPTNASFASPYQVGLLDLAAAGGAEIKNALFELSPDGKGKLGAITFNGQAANQNAGALTQTTSGATYNFNGNGSATLAIPLPSATSLPNALFTGFKTIFVSADGNFILGWTAGGFDIFFGVKALAAKATNKISQGLYFTAALEVSEFFGPDSYYGSTDNSGDSAGDAIVHLRLNVPQAYSFDYGTDDQINLNPDGTTGTDSGGYEYVFGDDGRALVGIGTDGDFSLVVGLHAAAFSGTGVYLNPIGVVNAASNQPITASLAPGELITLYGTGLSSQSMSTQGGKAFPTTLGGVSVSINGLPCPIYYVTQDQLSVIVPYEVASNQTGLADIQVTNNGVPSNIVQMYLTDSAPGAFSQDQSGIGYAAAVHASTGALVTPSDPAQPGEYLSLYMTGLGTVSPAIQDGALGPTGVLSKSDLNNANNFGVYFNDYGPDGSTGNPGDIQYAGLAPGLAGLYQVNVQVPTSGLADGDNVYIEFVTDASDVDQIQIPYGSSSGSSTVTSVRLHGHAARLAAMQSRRRNPKPHRARVAR